MPSRLRGRKIPSASARQNRAVQPIPPRWSLKAPVETRGTANQRQADPVGLQPIGTPAATRWTSTWHERRSRWLGWDGSPGLNAGFPVRDSPGIPCAAREQGVPKPRPDLDVASKFLGVMMICIYHHRKQLGKKNQPVRNPAKRQTTTASASPRGSGHENGTSPTPPHHPKPAKTQPDNPKRRLSS